jgi:3,4-dihydroxy 2-butanone 4-phosphate synthase/GTP cyclohydrolase II
VIQAPATFGKLNRAEPFFYGESPVTSIYAETNLPTVHGTFRLRAYRFSKTVEPLAMISGYINRKLPIAVRIHSSCLTSEVLGSCKCDCKQQLDASLAYIQEHTGVVIYLQQEGRGIGLGDKVRVYALQEHGYDTIEANEMLGLPIDARQYDDAVSILRDLGISRVNLLTNNPEKISALVKAGIEVVERTAIATVIDPHAASYMETKKVRMGHILE